MGAVAALALLAGCGSGGSDGSGGSGEEGGPLVVWTLENLPDRLAVQQEIAAAFTEESGVEVELVAIDEDQQLAMAALALEDRQRALNDRRMLESMRAEAMDVKRRYYLAHCAKGTNNAQD